jgi:hypothetical protein
LVILHELLHDARKDHGVQRARKHPDAVRLEVSRVVDREVSKRVLPKKKGHHDTNKKKSKKGNPQWSHQPARKQLLRENREGRKEKEVRATTSPGKERLPTSEGSVNKARAKTSSSLAAQ